jgi:glutamate/tyrosine decarboxylase-like PLP-dependent enzyme
MTVYASSEVHSCNQKALELLGLGADGLRRVPVRDDYTADVDALRRTIAEDRGAGMRPICVIGSAGTVNTGAIDDLAALAQLCRDEDLWFHVDGAIGAVAMLAGSVRERLAGIEQADSLALDLHKWMHIPFEAACALVRHADRHRDTFSLTPAYLQRDSRGIAAGSPWFSDYGLQLTRGFRALKVWMSIKEHGLDRLGRMMERNVEQARYLGTLIDESSELERMAPIGLDIVCFRFNPGGIGDDRLDAVNKEILLRLQEQGIAAPSHTILNGRYCLRVAIANHRSRGDDFDLLVAETVRIGREVMAAGR